jgi:asparagine synthase (glutamine-hydrolysing)
MCGITGIVDFVTHPTEDQVKQMTDELIHRGPDFGKVLSKGPCVMGHRRLKIIDLSDQANQPWETEDGRYTLVFNGEIYNYKDLREELTEKGVEFKTSSDTEVLLQALIRWKVEALEKLNGIFAFALWDAEEEQLFAARDHVGVKPFYFKKERTSFKFASEIKAVIQGSEIQVNKNCIPEILQFGFVAGSDTIFEGVQRLQPGEFLTYNDGILHRETYYSNMPGGLAEVSYQDAVEMVEEKLDDAIAMQMVSDVPVGTMCSGGVDSSFITARSAEVQPNTRAYCVKIPFEGYDETRYAQIAANSVGSPLSVLDFDLDEAFDLLPTLIWLHDEPIRHPNSIPIYQVSDLARRDVTVLLSGEGADEIFAGYGSYRAIARLRKLNRIPRFFNPLLRLASKITGKGREVVLAHRKETLAEQLIYLRAFMQEEELKKLCPSSNLDISKRIAIMEKALAFCAGDVVNALLFYDQRTHLATLLDRQDKMCMGTSVESRVPFLDVELVDLANELPSEYKLGGQTKRVFRDVAKSVLPEEIFNRPKYPFAVPILRLYLETKRGLNYLENILPTSFLFKEGILDQKQWNRLFKNFKSGNEYYAEVIWNIINLDIWYRIFIEKSIQPERSLLSYQKLNLAPA